MPWIGLTNENERVIPEQVEDGARVFCPGCRTKMYPRGPASDGKARHFVHLSSTFSDCEGEIGGESEQHRIWKSMAVSALKQQFDDQYARCEPEAELDVSATESARETRRADVLLEFQSEHDLFGRGIIIEVQYRNRGKDLQATTHDYLSKGYSLYWTSPDDFTDSHFRLNDILAEFEESDDAYLATETAPDDLLPLDSPTFAGERYYYDERADGATNPSMRQEDGCEHRWKEVDEFSYTCFECNARLHANPEIPVDPHIEAKQAMDDAEGDSEVHGGYVISLSPEESFEKLAEFEPRGILVEVHRDTHRCYNCEVEYAHVVGFDGLNLYDVSEFGEKVSHRSDIPLRNVGGDWRLYCPVCNRSRKYIRGTEMASIYYTGEHITTVWLPDANAKSLVR